MADGVEEEWDVAEVVGGIRRVTPGGTKTVPFWAFFGGLGGGNESSEDEVVERAGL